MIAIAARPIAVAAAKIVSLIPHQGAALLHKLVETVSNAGDGVAIQGSALDVESPRSRCRA